MTKNYDPAVTPANQQRRKEHARDDAWTRAFLHRAQIGHMVTVWESQPFINPSTFWYDEANNKIIFHSNLVGRMRANAEHSDKVTFEASEFGRLLPSNVALEFSIQYASVIVYGRLRVLEDLAEKEQALYGLIGKYFGNMTAGKEYRPITETELKRTSVYAIEIESWSGKENWAEVADQSDEWPPLSDAILSGSSGLVSR
ncbi:MAG: pyridoxamine 5'-phosphate oxidase family protein [Anaerolineales bacterium]|nr:pyridoxamine 5'-phosphate oxidase family protein [Anaerolineales bacterium]